MTKYVLDPVTEMVSVAKQSFGAGSLVEQEYQERFVRLDGVAAFAGQDKVVATIVGGLSLAGCYMVERERNGCVCDPAIGADRAVVPEQPLARFRIGNATGRL